MSDSNIGAGGTDLFVPAEQASKVAASVQEFDLGDGPVTATIVTYAAPVSDIDTKIQAGDNAVITGKGQSDSSTTIKKPEAAPAGAQARNAETTTILRYAKTFNEDLTIKAKKGSAVDLQIAEGKFRRSSFRGAKGKQDDSVMVGSSAKLINSSFDLRKGDDTFEITGGANLRKTTTVDLGKGADNVIVGNGITGKGKLVIKNMDKKDTLTYNGEDYTLKQIQNGDADLPGFLELG